jgi:hypothetical protein
MSAHQENAMKMVWHNYHLIDLYICESPWDVFPSVEDCAASRIQAHPGLDDVSEQACAMVHTDGDKIGTRSRIIVLTQAKRTTMNI